MFEVEYIKATDLEDAIDFLNTNGVETKILAGGTDIMVDMRSGALKTRFLLDVSSNPIPSLKWPQPLEKQPKNLPAGKYEMSPLSAATLPTVRRVVIPSPHC